MPVCGFFGLDGTVSEAELRAAVRNVALSEHDNWFDAAGAALGERVDGQFGHFLRYWLARQEAILPSTLTYLQAKAVDTATDYGDLLDWSATAKDVDAEIPRVGAHLLADAPSGGTPANLSALVEAALRGAYQSRTGVDAWSSVFVISCIRGAAILCGLEGESGGLHLGINVLLKAHEGHRFYVKEAYDRRLGSNPRSGTYHAFDPADEKVQVGDIIVQDRDADDESQVKDFAEIPDIPDAAYELHADIVVEVTFSYAETVGGNIGFSQLAVGDNCSVSSPAQPFTVRRRRYPLDSGGNGKIFVALEQLFAQEDDSGNLSPLPVTCSDDILHKRSMRRVFTLLRPVEHCVTP